MTLWQLDFLFRVHPVNLKSVGPQKHDPQTNDKHATLLQSFVNFYKSPYRPTDNRQSLRLAEPIAINGVAEPDTNVRRSIRFDRPTTD